MTNLTKSSLLILLLSLFIIGCSDKNEQEINQIEAAKFIQVFDIGNNENSSDIRLFFNATSTFEDVSEFRIIISKANSANAVDLETALAIGPDRYDAMTVGASQAKHSLSAGVLDIDGNPILNATEYRILILAIPKSADAEAKLSSPSNSFSLNNKDLKDLYISSSGRNSVELFDGVTGEFIKTFIAPRAGNLSDPQEVIFLEDGSLLVTGFGNAKLKRYDGETGNFIEDFTSGYSLDKPTKTSIGPDGHLYVSQWGNTQNAIVRFNLKTGVFIDEVVNSFSQGMDQSWDSQGNFYTVSWGLGELRKYNSSFELQENTKNQLTGPVNLWIDDSDILFVVDWTTGSVKRFDTDLNYLNTFITGLANVEGYLFDGDELLLCDWQLGMVNRYNASNGNLLSMFISSNKLNNANSITFGPNHQPN